MKVYLIMDWIVGLKFIRQQLLALRGPFKERAVGSTPNALGHRVTRWCQMNP